MQLLCFKIDRQVEFKVLCNELISISESEIVARLVILGSGFFGPLQKMF
ncbi:MAG: hypothetical protein ACI9B9_002685 [Halioglobus sp.]|jgi:hypothetical protein